MTAALRVLLSFCLGALASVAAAVQHFKADAPAVNPYRVTGLEVKP